MAGRDDYYERLENKKERLNTRIEKSQENRSMYGEKQQKILDAIPMGQKDGDARVRGRKAPCGEGEAQGEGTGGNGTGSVHPAGEVRLHRTVRTDTGNAGSEGTDGKGIYPLHA